MKEIDLIRQTKIKEDDGNGEYLIFDSTNFEYVNPIEHYFSAFSKSSFTMMKELVFRKKPPFPFPLETIDRVLLKEAEKSAYKKIEKTLQTEVPENLISVLSAKSKSEQVRLLKNQSINSDQLFAFILKAHNDFGYKFSQYVAEHHHKGLDQSEMPKLIEIKDGSVRKIGKTNLSDGQLKQVIDQRKVIVSKFFDKQDEWHCLFLTFDSLRGKESWKNGQPHFHYISNRFGLSREKVVKELQESVYKLGSLPHIDLID